MITSEVTLSPESIDALARRIVEIRGESEIPSAPEISTADAVRLTRRRSKSAFYRWCKVRRVKAISPGYYRRAAIMRALGACA